MIKETEIIKEVIEYLENLGYRSDMVDYEINTPSDRRVDLVVKSGNSNLIAIEIKTNTDIFKISDNEISYHSVARKLQRDAQDIGAKYFVVSNGYQAVWLTTGNNGRPKVTQPIKASHIDFNELSEGEYLESLLNSSVNYLERYPLTGEISYDLSIFLYHKLTSDIGGIPYFDGADKYDVLENSNSRNVISHLLERVKGINFYEQRTYILSFVDKFLLKNRFDWQVPRWMANFMISLYPQNAPRENCLDLFCKNGTIISSALKDGWHNVKGIYFSKNNEFWIKVQQLLSSGREYEIEFNPDLLVDKTYLKNEHNYDCTFLAPPFGLKIDTNHTFDKVDSVELLLEKAINQVKELGFIIVIVPDGFLLSTRFEKFRKRLLNHVSVRGIINLSPEAFKPHSGVSTSILVLQNKRDAIDSTFCSSLEVIPSSVNSNKNIEEILENWKAFNKGASFEFSKSGFIMDKLDSNNFHFSNYWFKEYQNNLDTLQDGFQAIPLKEVVENIKRGTVFKRDKNEEIPFLAPASVRTMKIMDGELSYTSKKLMPSNPVIARTNDILINIIGTQRGSAAIVEEYQEGMGINHHLILIRPKQSLISPYYLAIILNSTFVQNQLQEGSSGTVIPSLSLRSFESIFIPIPPLRIQESICEKYKELNFKIEEKEKELSEHRKFLKDYLSGIGKGGSL